MKAVKIGLIGFAVLVILLVLWAVNVFVGNSMKVVEKTFEADNIIHNYEWFYDVNAAYDARLAQVHTFQTYLSEEEDAAEKRKVRMELAAVTQSCRDLATKYNANSEKMNRSIFKGWQLPHTLEMKSCG